MSVSPWVLALCGIGFAVSMFLPAGDAQNQLRLNLMPIPASAQTGIGALPIAASFSVALTGYQEPRLDRAIQRFYRQLSRQTGIPLVRRDAEAGKATLLIRTEHASKPVQELGEDESYALEVTLSGARLTAATPLGTMHGLQTFLQLVDVSPKL